MEPMKKPRRTRRTSEDARRAILDAAEKRLEAVGPAGLRLQDVAADVGIGHPAILHHFGSREGLVKAVIARSVEALHEDLFRTIAAAGKDERPPSGVDLFERTFETLGARGHARLIAWLLLSGYDPLDSDVTRRGWTAIAEATHALRTEAWKAQKRKREPDFEDTLFAVIASSLALFGQAIAGPSIFEITGYGRDPNVEKRFRLWLASLFTKHLEEASFDGR
jgi:AcrR family transcriptional regulator